MVAMTWDGLGQWRTQIGTRDNGPQTHATNISNVLITSENTLFKYNNKIVIHLIMTGLLLLLLLLQFMLNSFV